MLNLSSHLFKCVHLIKNLEYIGGCTLEKGGNFAQRFDILYSTYQIGIVHMRSLVDQYRKNIFERLLLLT